MARFTDDATPFNFRGRRTRLSFFLKGWLVAIASAPPAIVAALLRQDGGLDPLPTIIEAGAWIVFAWPNLSLAAQRCHDLGWSGWWSLASLAPTSTNILGITIDLGEPWSASWILLVAVFAVGVVFNLVLIFLRGTSGLNRFGPDPLFMGDEMPPPAFTER